MTATAKQSFVLYNDLIDVVKQLPPAKVSDLFIHILEYANGNEPKSEDLLINVVFEPIRQGMERNKLKWTQRAEKAKENGSKGGRPPKTKSEPEKPSGLFKNQTEPEKPVSVPVPVSVSNKLSAAAEKKILKEAFEGFWKFYGKTSDKKKCLDKWLQNVNLENIDHVRSSLKIYVEKTSKDITYRKNPLTWLNGQCWLDYPIGAKPELGRINDSWEVN